MRLIVEQNNKVTLLRVLPFLLIVLASCGESTPEERLEAVGDDLSSTTSELATLNKKINEAESTLTEYRDTRRDLRDKVRTLEERLEVRATDVALFRAVQTAILEHPDLRQSAVAVSVEDGQVTLSGIVRSDEEAQQAVAVAKQTAGVRDLSSHIRVNDPANEDSGT